LNRFEVKGMYEGSPYRLLLHLSLPIFMGMLVSILYTITDTLWISRINMSDPGLVGGVGLIFPLVILTMAISSGILVGVNSLVSRSIGKDDRAILEKVGDNGLFLAFLASTLYTIPFYIFSKEIISALGATGSYYTTAHTYLIAVIPAASTMFFSAVFNGILQGEGKMRLVMNSMVIGTIANITLDPILIFGFDMGVKGAAIATVVANSLSLFYSLSVFLRKKSAISIGWKLSSISKKVSLSIISIALPQSLSHLIMAVAIVILNRVLISVDATAMTAYAICGRVDSMLFTPIFAMSSALVTAIGQNFGKKNYKRVALLWHSALKMAAAIVFIMAAVLVVFAHKIIPLFSNSSEVIFHGIRQMRIVEFTYIGAVFGILARSVFQGIGDAVPALILTTLRLLLLGIPATIFAVYVLDLGVLGVYLGLIFGNLITAIVSFIWIEKKIKSLGSIN
jgi:putative MATE family efflux protein